MKLWITLKDGTQLLIHDAEPIILPGHKYLELLQHHTIDSRAPTVCITEKSTGLLVARGDDGRLARLQAQVFLSTKTKQQIRLQIMRRLLHL